MGAATPLAPAPSSPLSCFPADQLARTRYRKKVYALTRYANNCLQEAVVGFAVMTLCVLGQSPAQASGDAEDGALSIGAIGDGPRVREARVLLDGWKPGVRARISEWRGGTCVREIRGRKHMTSKQQSRYRYEIATWKLDKGFRHERRICAEVSGHEERMPCVTIKR